VLRASVSTVNPYAESVTYFGVNFPGFERVGFEGPAIGFEGPATGPLIGSGEEIFMTVESSVAGAGVVNRVYGRVGIGGARPYSGEGEAERLLGNDAIRAMTNVFEIVFASQPICGAGVVVREMGRGDDVSGTISPPESATGPYSARNHS